MSKNLSVKRTLFTGTLLLTTAGILSRFIGFFYKIFLHMPWVRKESASISLFFLYSPYVMHAPPPVLNLPSPVSPPEL